jgi:hypothetical protein
MSSGIQGIRQVEMTKINSIRLIIKHLRVTFINDDLTPKNSWLSDFEYRDQYPSVPLPFLSGELTDLFGD